MTYPTPPIPPAQRSSASGSSLFTEDRHPVFVGVAVVAGILLWLGFLFLIPTLV